MHAVVTAVVHLSQSLGMDALARTAFISRSSGAGTGSFGTLLAGGPPLPRDDVVRRDMPGVGPTAAPAGAPPAAMFAYHEGESNGSPRPTSPRTIVDGARGVYGRRPGQGFLKPCCSMCKTRRSLSTRVGFEHWHSAMRKEEERW